MKLQCKSSNISSYEDLEIEATNNLLEEDE